MLLETIRAHQPQSTKQIAPLDQPVGADILVSLEGLQVLRDDGLDLFRGVRRLAPQYVWTLFKIYRCNFMIFTSS